LQIQTRLKPSDFSGKKILSMPSFGGEVKLSVPCCRFAACKRSLNGIEKASFWQNYWIPFSPQFHLSILGALTLLGTWMHLVAKVGTSKRQGKAMTNYS
jgi:hypothetical protein